MLRHLLNMVCNSSAKLNTAKQVHVILRKGQRIVVHSLKYVLKMLGVLKVYLETQKLNSLGKKDV